MADNGAFPTWGHTGHGVEVAWDQVGLGSDFLPGIWFVDGLDAGVDVDTKKAKGADGPTSTDNGVDAKDFQLVGHLKAADWEAYCAVFPNFNPRRPGRDRQPVLITHPLTALHGIAHVRVLRVSHDPPTGKSGMRVKISVIEWFDKPKATPKKKQNEANNLPPAPPAQIVGIENVMDHFARRHGFKSDREAERREFNESVQTNMFEPPITSFGF